MSPDDDTDVAAAQAGDRAALDRLLRSHQPRLYAVCRRVTGNDADAADACQETLITIVRRLSTFDGRSRFATWAYRVAVNASLDELRRRKRRPEPQETITDRAGGYEQDGSADRLDVDAALRQLPPDFRAAVVLRDLCALDYSEISEVLGIPPGTVRSRISRGRAALAPLLGNPTEGDDRPIRSPQ
jgi:RNA polymerase sigma-70 factor (ECF subfamily)